MAAPNRFDLALESLPGSPRVPGPPPSRPAPRTRVQVYVSDSPRQPHGGSPRFTPRPPAGSRGTARPVPPRVSAVGGMGVRAGGRLYVESPVAGYTDAEMIEEARIRITHNKQRQALKRLLSTAADGGPLVSTKDLLLACQMAKLETPREATRKDGCARSSPPAQTQT